MDVSYAFSDANSSPANSWPLDQFVQDPGYLAYQEELRCLIFNTAQTAAPTREASPVSTTTGVQGSKDGVTSTDAEDDHAAQAQTREALAVGRRLEYLKNYVAEVAPWVSNNK